MVFWKMSLFYFLCEQQKVLNCERCSSWINESSVLTNGDVSASSLNNNKEDTNVMTKVKELELELAQTKLALVEAECRNDVSTGLKMN